MEQGMAVPRKEPGNKEGKQKPLTEPWTGAGKSSIILWKTPRSHCSSPGRVCAWAFYGRASRIIRGHGDGV